MNPFERYGIPHLSPSTCNMFVGSPAAFVLTKCFKKSSPVGAAAHRGTAVEAGVVRGLSLCGDDVEGCADFAVSEFDRLCALSTDNRREKERAAVPEMVRVGLEELKPYGAPTSTQGKIEYAVEGLAVPMIGYYDIEWSNHKILIDIKTTHALPSKISTNHARQVALYVAAKGNTLEPRLTYITPKKCATYRLENVADHVKALENIALNIQSFLSVSDDPMVLARMTAPDVDSFYFSDPLTRQYVYEIWGL